MIMQKSVWYIIIFWKKGACHFSQKSGKNTMAQLVMQLSWYCNFKELKPLRGHFICLILYNWVLVGFWHHVSSVKQQSGFKSLKQSLFCVGLTLYTDIFLVSCVSNKPSKRRAPFKLFPLLWWINYPLFVWSLRLCMPQCSCVCPFKLTQSSI